METPIHSILIIRLSAIGDIVMASPLIAALRRRYPQAHIAWLVQPEGRDLLAANELLDEVIVWPRQQWRGLWRQRRFITLIREIKTFVSELRQRHFDLVLDVQGLLKSGIWAWLSGARQRIGLGSREGSARLMTRVIVKPQNDLRISSEYRALADDLGLETREFGMQLALTDEDHRFAEQIIQQHQLNQGYVVLCPFTTRPQKHWLTARWPQLATQIREQLGLPAIMLGGPADQPAAQQMLEHDTQVINLVGQTRLRQAVALIAQARALIGVDTGLTHMGIACAIPVIALFGSTCPYQQTGLQTTRIIYKALPCSPCRRNPTCDGRFDCMQQISVAEVVATLCELTPRQAKSSVAAPDQPMPRIEQQDKP